MSGVITTSINEIIKETLKKMELPSDRKALVILSNAAYINLPVGVWDSYLEDISQEIGYYPGPEQIAAFQQALNSPLKLALYNMNTKQVSVIISDGNTVTVEDLDLAYTTITNPDNWAGVQKKLKMSTFSIVSILTSWNRKLPGSFLKAVEFHNHLCPGVITGYLLVKYINAYYPLEKGEKYVWYGYPSSCRDDALQVCLDLTCGKKMLKNTICYGEEVEQSTGNNPEGLLFKINQETKEALCVCFSSDFSKPYGKAQLSQKDFLPEGSKNNPLFFINRIKGNVALLPFLDKPEDMIRVDIERLLTSRQIKELLNSEVHPFSYIMS